MGEMTNKNPGAWKNCSAFRPEKGKAEIQLEKYELLKFQPKPIDMNSKLG